MYQNAQNMSKRLSLDGIWTHDLAESKKVCEFQTKALSLRHKASYRIHSFLSDKINLFLIIAYWIKNRTNMISIVDSNCKKWQYLVNKSWKSGKICTYIVHICRHMYLKMASKDGYKSSRFESFIMHRNLAISLFKNWSFTNC